MDKEEIKKYITAFLIYTVIGLALFANVFANPSQTTFSSGSNLYIDLLSMWWINYAAFHLHASLWHTNNLFWPIGANLLQYLSPLSSFIVAPFEIINSVFAFNILMLFGLAISGLGMFALGLYILKNYYSALISGVIFSFSAFHIAQYFSGIGFFIIAWAPVSLLFLIKIFNEEKNRFTSSIMLGISFALACLMGSVKQGFILILLFIVIAIAYALKKADRRHLNLDTLKYILIAIGIAFIIGSFEFIPYIIHAAQITALNKVQIQGTLMKYYSLNVLSFFIPSYYNNLLSISNFKNLFYPFPWNKIGYIGYVALVLAAIGLYKNRDSLKYAAIAVVFFFLSLGPFIQIGKFILYSNIYYFIYMHIPFISLITQPNLFMLASLIMISIVAGFGLNSIQTILYKKWNGNLFYAIVVILIILFLIESAGLPLLSHANKVSSPKFFSYAKNISENFSIFYLPAFPNYSAIDPFYYQALYSYYTINSGKNIIGGYLPNENTSQQMLLLDIPLAIQAYSLQTIGSLTYKSMINENYSNQTLLLLYNYNAHYVVLNREAYNQSQLAALGGYLTNLFGKPIYVGNSTIAFSTINAFKNLYKTYVGYPQFNTWQMINKEVNGTTLSFWNPNESFKGMRAGLIAEFAPEENLSIINKTINTKINFYAMSNTHSEVILAELENINNSQQLIGIARFNVTNKMQEFSANTMLNQGPKGNLIAFIVPDNSTGIYNLTFSST